MLDRIKSGRETLPVEQALLVLLVSLPTCCCYRLLAFGSVWGCCHDTWGLHVHCLGWERARGGGSRSL